MPRVPTYDALQVGANVLPAARVSAPQLPDFAGQQAQQFSQATGNLAASTGRIAADMTQQANQLRIDDALNQAKEAALKLTFDKDEGFSGLAGVNALERPDGKPLADEYGGRLQSRLDEIAGTLGNDAQRRAFAQGAGGILANFRGQAIKHEASEYKTYALSVTEGIQATAMRDIAMNWNNPDAINAAVHRVQAQVYRQAQLSGMSAEWQEMQSRKLTSAAHKTALVAALQNNDPAYAGAYLTRYASQMDADDILAVRGQITKEMDSREGVAAATEAVRRHPIETSETERAFNILLGTESGNRQFDADGNPLTSSAGAVGIAQVTKGTGPEAARLAGLPWDEERWRTDEAYNRALGLAYFQEQLRVNRGDLPRAYAAYNAGPGRLAEALKKAEKDGGDWLALLPTETQNYVAKNMNEFNAGQGQGKRRTLAGIEADLQNHPRVAGNPDRLKIARVEAERQYNVQTAALKQRDDEAVKTVLDALIQNGGNFADLPASMRTSIPPDKYTSMLAEAGRIAQGQHRANDSLTWAEISSMSPDQLAAMTPLEFHNTYRTRLDDAHLERGYAMVLAARGESSDPKHLEILTTSARVKQAAQRAGILPFAGKIGDEQAKRFDQFQGVIDQRVRVFESTQLQGKRKASSDELQKIIDETLMDTVSTSRWWWKDRTDQLTALLPDDKLGDAYVKVGREEIRLSSVPADQRMAIINELQSHNRPVTEQAIAELWVRAGKPK